MPKLRVYIDTSVLGAIYDIEDPSRVEATKSLLEVLKAKVKYTPFISNIVVEEIERAPPDIRGSLRKIVGDMKVDILYEMEECIGLVDEYLKKKIIPRRDRDDARHIAVAVLNNMDVIITWNCRHMANIEKKRMVNAVNMMLGYRQIDIVTPMEVIGYG